MIFSFVGIICQQSARFRIEFFLNVCPGLLNRPGEVLAVCREQEKTVAALYYLRLLSRYELYLVCNRRIKLRRYQKAAEADFVL